VPTSITYSKADGIDRNEPGVAADLLELLARGKPPGMRTARQPGHILDDD